MKNLVQSKINKFIKTFNLKKRRAEGETVVLRAVVHAFIVDEGATENTGLF